MGDFACPAGDCWVARPAGPTSTFAGSTLRPAYVRCRDGSWANVGALRGEHDGCEELLASCTSVFG
jgi:hypothetical protein